jgi:hypothetical protein
MKVPKASTLIEVLLILLVKLISDGGLYEGRLRVCWRGLHRLILLVLYVSDIDMWTVEDVPVIAMARRANPLYRPTPASRAIPVPLEMSMAPI